MAVVRGKQISLYYSFDETTVYFLHIVGLD